MYIQMSSFLLTTKLDQNLSAVFDLEAVITLFHVSLIYFTITSIGR